MKKLRITQNRLQYSVLIILIFCHCSTKNLSTQKSRKAIHNVEDVFIQSSESSSRQGSRIISTSDSANNQFRVNIFPIDTFSFSLQNGFRGKASMIEVVGTSQEVKKITDSSSFQAERQDKTQYERKSSTNEKTFNQDKTVEKRKSSITAGFFILVVLGVLTCLVVRKWKFSGINV